ncbi:nucleoside transporter C-terminal domain-containing protein [Clostridium sp. D53t1_180928_C8]|uniref:NupC/NupG family nucleoside CNT transporter n=1 Tax=Clostridium sp. D53t1_180928_C8 TaxID=2787101 RepID=UPI0018A9459B|nr:nucleoside transporter C-terminal domain-containing protein [Clostridium sp. D53t1_180928_C8]
MKILISLLGIVVILSIMYIMSTNKKNIPYKTILKAVSIQFIIAFILVKFPLGRLAVEKVSSVVTRILDYGKDGLAFLFGSLADGAASTGFIFAIQTLGNIIFVSALVAALYYLGILGFVVKIIGKAVGKLLGTTQVESFVAVANMFLGQTESPILVSKYLNKMTESEILVVLVSGMGSMSATIIGGYTALGIPMEYLLIASALVPMGSIAISKILYPEIEEARQFDDISMDRKGDNENLIGAISEGAMSGLNTALAIGASLIAIIALVAMVNGFLGIFGTTLQDLLSYLFAPIGWLMGLDGKEVLTAGQMLGTKIALNEFVAFEALGKILNELSYRTGLIITISLCGFANISSMGVCISGISALCPEKKNTLAKLAFKAMIGGFTVSVLSAMIVGVITLI